MSRHIIALQIFAAFSKEFADCNLMYGSCLYDIKDADTFEEYDKATNYALHRLEKLISEIQF